MDNNEEWLDEDFEPCCFDPECDLCHGCGEVKKEARPEKRFSIKLGDFCFKGK